MGNAFDTVDSRDHKPPTGGDMLVSKLLPAVYIGRFKRVCHHIFTLAHRDPFRSAYRCALFAAFVETFKRLQNVLVFGGVLTQPSAEKALEAAA